MRQMLMDSTISATTCMSGAPIGTTTATTGAHRNEIREGRRAAAAGLRGAARGCKDEILVHAKMKKCTLVHRLYALLHCSWLSSQRRRRNRNQNQETFPMRRWQNRKTRRRSTKITSIQPSKFSNGGLFSFPILPRARAR